MLIVFYAEFHKQAFYVECGYTVEILPCSQCKLSYFTYFYICKKFYKTTPFGFLEHFELETNW